MDYGFDLNVCEVRTSVIKIQCENGEESLTGFNIASVQCAYTYIRFTLT